METTRANNAEKGFVLILALVTMVAMMLIGLSLIMNITTDVQLARNEKESMLTFQLAEAGVREASARFHLPSANARYIGEKSTDAGYRTTAWTKQFDSSTAVIGTLPADQRYRVTITYLDETNPEGYCDSNANNNLGAINANVNDSLTASANFSLTPSTDSATCVAKGGVYNAATLTCSWGCNNGTSEIVMYGQDFNLTSAVTSLQYGTLPVYRIQSDATVNNTTRTIVAYLGESNLNVETFYGINTNGCVTTAGAGTNATIVNDIEGMGHSAGNVLQGSSCACPSFGSYGGTPSSCATNKTANTNLDTYLGDTIPNIKSYADQTITCTTAPCTVGGSVWNGNLSTVVTSWSGSGAQEGVLLVVDNAGGADANMNGNINGEGILIVTGNLTIGGSIKWEGLIYVLGNITINGLGGDGKIEGGIMAGGNVQINGTGGEYTVEYKPEELLEMARQTSSSATTVWKRL